MDAQNSITDQPAKQNPSKTSLLSYFVVLDIILVLYGLFTSHGVAEYKLTWFIGAQVFALLLSFSMLFFQKKSTVSLPPNTKTPLRNILLVVYMFGTIILFLAWVFFIEYSLATSVVRSKGVNVNSKVIDYSLTTNFNSLGILHVGGWSKTKDVNQADNLYVKIQFDGHTERYVIYRDVIHSQGSVDFAKIVDEVKSGTLPVRYLPKTPYILRTQIETKTQS